MDPSTTYAHSTRRANTIDNQRSPNTAIRRNLRAREGHFRVVPLAVPYVVWELLTNHCNLNF